MCRVSATLFLGGLVALATARVEATVDHTDSLVTRQVLAVDRTLPSVVSISALGKSGEEFGSGIVVTANGAVLTGLHVVDRAETIAFKTHDGREFLARVVATDPQADLALLRPTGKVAGLQPVRFGDDAALRLGEPLFAIGNPFGLGWSISHGILSGRNRRNLSPGAGVGLLQTDAPINPGSSGGPIINRRGEVVGMVNAILTNSGHHQGVGFAVPARELRYALRFLEQGENVRRAWLGLRVKERKGVEPGLAVINARGPGAKAGVRQADVILRLDGQRIEKIADMRRVLRQKGVGMPIRIGIRRGAELISLWATTGTLTKP